jgi:hypothetical protein
VKRNVCRAGECAPTRFSKKPGCAHWSRNQGLINRERARKRAPNASPSKIEPSPISPPETDRAFIESSLRSPRAFLIYSVAAHDAAEAKGLQQASPGQRPGSRCRKGSKPQRGATRVPLLPCRGCDRTNRKCSGCSSAPGIHTVTAQDIGSPAGASCACASSNLIGIERLRHAPGLRLMSRRWCH